MKNVFGFVLAALCALTFAACPQDTATAEKYDTIDSRLVASWELFINNAKATGNDARTFKINADGTFEARLNPGGEGQKQGWGDVQGKLVRKGNDYLMVDMTGDTDDYHPGWAGQAGQMTAGKYCQITFTSNDIFNYGSLGNKTINDFFGGEYHRVTP